MTTIGIAMLQSVWPDKQNLHTEPLQSLFGKCYTLYEHFLESVLLEHFEGVQNSEENDMSQVNCWVH